MRTGQVRTILSLIVTTYLCIAASGQQAGRIESMKLLTPNVGWAATNKRLFWTTDAGAQWKDVTPPAKEPKRIASVFFLDVANGWVLLAYSAKENPATGISETLFELASTADSGANWSVRHLDVPDPDLSRGLSGEAWLDFVDSRHGWLLVRMNGSTAVSMGVFRATEDGGRTWRSLGVPAAGPIRFVTPTDGWMEGGPTEDVTQGVYVTRDGGRIWTIVTQKAPQAMGEKTYPTYHLPQFADKDTGFLLVTFSEPNDESPKLALFTTKDGGRAWTFGSAIAEGGSSWYATAVGTDWLAAGCPGGKLTLARAAGGAMSVASPAAGKTEGACAVPSGGVLGLTFGDSNRGWLMLLSGRLLSTEDGGGTWTDITPAQAARAAGHGQSTALPVRSKQIDGLPPARQLEPPSTSVSAHVGFDKFPVIPKTSDMQNWMNSSPFYDVGIYLPGSKNKSDDANLTPAWVSAVLGQGWGIMPLWFGLQSACSCYVDKTGNCVPFTYQISTNLTQAKTQGINEATAANNAAKNLGLSPSIIYKDIENYTPDGSTCSLPVQAFLSGWDQQMDTVGKAGVYGNPPPAAKDFSKASPIPDDVWIARYTATGQAPLLTIWALGALGYSPYWTNSQRIHQGQQNLMQAWGNTTNYKIDPDIEDAPVVNANTVVKAYTYGTPIDISCTGALNTYPTAINDISNGVPINGPGQMGTVVGMLQATIGGPNYAFQNTAGTCTTINVFGSTIAEATGINNLGQIVGYFEGSDGKYHGFLQSAGGSPTQIDYNYNGQTAIATYLYGINDAGQAVGYAYSPGTFYYQSFIYYASQFYPTGYTGNLEYTLGRGISGDATVTGIYYYQPASEDFELSAIPPSWSGNVIGLTPGGIANTEALGINANNELAGYYYSSACNDTAGECGFEWPGGLLLNVLAYGSAASAAEGINDFAQVVGAYTDSTTQYSHGLWWTHQ